MMMKRGFFGGHSVGFLRPVKWMLAIGILCGTLTTAGVGLRAAEMTPAESEQLKTIGALTAKLLEYNHFRKQVLDAAFASRLFEEYFRSIDPAKSFFTKEDIARFEAYRFSMLRQLNTGNLDQIFAIYQCYLERLKEFRSFADEALVKEFDFSTEEEYLVERKDADYPADDNELHSLWRKKLKNDVLYYRLFQKMMQEQSQSDSTAAAELEKLWNKRSPEEKVKSRLHDLYNNASQLDKTDILGIFLTSLAQLYGPHSNYSSPKMVEDFDIQFNLQLSGIGATLTNEDGFTKIVDVVPNSPAARDGRLQVDDRIIAVAQAGAEPVDVIDMSVSNVVKLVRGPAGSKVILTVLPAKQGANAVPVNIELTRATVELQENAAKGEIRELDGRKIGIVTLNSFYVNFGAAARGEANYRSATRDVKAVLEDFKSKSVDAVVFDLRSNGGGSLMEAIMMSGLFIKEGPVVQIMDNTRELQVQYDPDPTVTYDGPMVMLVSKFTASSSEILTGMIQDYHRGVVVGDSRTYGKGTVLGMVDLKEKLGLLRKKFDAGSLTFETAVFYRVTGNSNQQKGIASDVVIPSFTEVMEVGEMFNENHLPWDRTTPTKFTPAMSEQAYQALTSVLQQKSHQRFTESEALQRYVSEIERYKEIRERKTISLNESRRLTEYRAEKAASDAAEALLSEGSGATDTVDAEDAATPRKKREDLVLDEAVAVARDYVEWTLQPTVKKETASWSNATTQQ